MWQIYQNKLKDILIALAIVMCLIFFDFRGWLNIPKSLSIKILYPIIYVGQSVVDRVYQSGNFFYNLYNITKDNYNLKQENLLLQSKLAQQNEILKIYENHKSQINFNSVYGVKTISANVISRNPDGLLSIWIINKGAKDGILDRLPVISNGSLIGMVVEVFDNYSKVKLITAEGSAIAAINGDNRIEGVIRGDRGLGLYFETSQNSPIIGVGDTIVSTKIENNMPKGILVGLISEILGQPGNIGQKAKVLMSQDIRFIDEVIIIL